MCVRIRVQKGAGTSLVVHLAHQLQVLRRRDGMVVDEFAIAVPSHIVDKEGEIDGTSL